MPKSKNTLGNAIREARTSAERTQAATAVAAGITQEYLSEIEAGKKEPSLAVLRRLAESLSVEISVPSGLILKKS